MKKIISLLLYGVLLVSFTACQEEPDVYIAPAPVMIDGHEAIDLGLPSGTLWATCNIGAEKPEETGTPFAWGEINPKDSYSWDNYQHGSYDKSSQRFTLTKYEYETEYPETFIDLLPEDDAATVHWGGEWRMPTANDFSELIRKCAIIESTRVNKNGIIIYGREIVGRNGNRIFVPCVTNDKDLYLWSSSLAWSYYESSSIAYALCPLKYSYEECVVDVVSRAAGLPIRPVCVLSK